MKETIYTIPLTDALAEGECPFCYLHKRTETELLRLYLEGGVMEPDWRGRLLQYGLCGDHLWRLFRASSRLGLALVAKSLLEQAGEHLARAENTKRPEDLPEPSCLACIDLANAFRHYAESFLLTYRREQDFRERTRRAGFCLPHLWALRRQMRAKRWKDADLEREIASAAYERLQLTRRDLEWFIMKFDYRFADEPWNGAEDALERALKILGGSDRG